MSSKYDALLGDQMDESGIQNLLTEQGVGVLSMANDGVPYGIPLSFGYDGEEYIYFLFVGYSEDWRKVTFAEQSDEVSFLVFDVESDERWRSAIVTGSLDRITPDRWGPAREAMTDNAYRPNLLREFDEQGDPHVWGLEIESMAGRAIGLDE